MISKLDIKLRTRIPPKATLLQPQPWTSQTPHNLTNLISQSELIKSRITNHLNNSLTQILNNAKHLVNGVAELAHRVIFLLNEIRSLQKANTALNKRRRAKKTRLRQGGVITARDARDELEQRNLGGSVGKEKGGNGGHEGGQRRGQRCCGVCGKPGHNARTCEKGKEESNLSE